MMLRYCRDKKVSKAGVEVRTGRKWNAQEVVKTADASLQHSDIIGTVTHGMVDWDWVV